MKQKMSWILLIAVMPVILGTLVWSLETSNPVPFLVGYPIGFFMMVGANLIHRP